MSGAPSSPCQSCGACCAAFRVSFYWSEAVATGLDASLVEPLNPWLSCLRGSNQPAPRCAALRGVVGQAVSCSVYAQRPSPCREVLPGDERCSTARARHGLPTLLPQEAAGF